MKPRNTYYLILMKNVSSAYCLFENISLWKARLLGKWEYSFADIWEYGYPYFHICLLLEYKLYHISYYFVHALL